MNIFMALFLIFLPSKIKIYFLQKRGFQVHESAYIGFSLLNIEKIELEKNTYIGAGNIFKGVSKLVMRKGSRINRWNYFTSAPKWKACILLNERASISLRHYFDVCADFEIGADTIIAGVRSTFFTHSKGIEVIDYVKPINIGDWCYVGSNTCFTPGSKVGDNCFVGMGTVVSKDFSDSHFSLIAGNPASIVKKIPKDCSYFSQSEIIHPHLKNK